MVHERFGIKAKLDNHVKRNIFFVYVGGKSVDLNDAIVSHGNLGNFRTHSDDGIILRIACIDANGSYDNLSVCLVINLTGQTARHGVNFSCGHLIGDFSMKRTNIAIGPVAVENEVIYPFCLGIVCYNFSNANGKLRICAHTNNLFHGAT